MIDAETYVSVLRDELAHVYAENLALKFKLAQEEYDPDQVLAFLSRVDPEWLEARLLRDSFDVPVGRSCLNALKEVLNAELGERT